MVEKQRINKVTTRGGDKGKTRLATGRSLDKFHPIVKAMGAIDELNSFIGVLRSLARDSDQDTLGAVQQALFDLGAVFAMEGDYGAATTDLLETATDTLNADLPPLTEFVLPGGGPAAAQAHVCRSVCRRAETLVWAVVSDTEPSPASYSDAARYLNRLSDYFFVLARSLTLTEETQWRGPAGRS
ncbi:MAG: cob(I)yrinic acid a,c-diamide adenosyltransferase [bacterium]